ncbi:MAG: hypothetical protein LBB20_00115 [Puniceicoccales bacterium]|jgi:hypothetical protein|nr:hypothetical protein [Puniceicoccales bacterium]
MKTKIKSLLLLCALVFGQANAGPPYGSNDYNILYKVARTMTSGSPEVMVMDASIVKAGLKSAMRILLCKKHPRKLYDILKDYYDSMRIYTYNVDAVVSGGLCIPLYQGGYAYQSGDYSGFIENEQRSIVLNLSDEDIVGYTIRDMHTWHEAHCYSKFFNPQEIDKMFDEDNEDPAVLRQCANLKAALLALAMEMLMLIYDISNYRGNDYLSEFMSFCINYLNTVTPLPPLRLDIYNTDNYCNYNHYLLRVDAVMSICLFIRKFIDEMINQFTNLPMTISD